MVAGEQQVPPLRFPFLREWEAPAGMTVCVGRALARATPGWTAGGGCPHMGNVGCALVIDDPLVAQLLEELADVGANLGWVRVGELACNSP
jgi:hypothetical protein